MAKTPEEIAAKVREIYDLVRGSETPIRVLSIQTTVLCANEDWTSTEIERVSGEVMGLLIRHGWNKPSV